jgi:hypothetical protein
VGDGNGAVADREHFGGIIASQVTGRIENMTVSLQANARFSVQGATNANGNHAVHYAGGITGRLANGATIDRVHLIMNNNTTIQARGRRRGGNSSAVGIAGGLVGRADGGTISNSTVTMNNNSIIGAQSERNNVGANANFHDYTRTAAGGFVGEVADQVPNGSTWANRSTSFGALTITNGRIISTSTSLISTSSWGNDVNNRPTTCAGGIIGAMANPVTIDGFVWEYIGIINVEHTKRDLDGLNTGDRPAGLIVGARRGSRALTLRNFYRANDVNNARISGNAISSWNATVTPAVTATQTLVTGTDFGTNAIWVGARNSNDNTSFTGSHTYAPGFLWGTDRNTTHGTRRISGGISTTGALTINYNMGNTHADFHWNILPNGTNATTKDRANKTHTINKGDAVPEGRVMRLADATFSATSSLTYNGAAQDITINVGRPSAYSAITFNTLNGTQIREDGVLMTSPALYTAIGAGTYRMRGIDAKDTPYVVELTGNAIYAMDATTRANTQYAIWLPSQTINVTIHRRQFTLANFNISGQGQNAFDGTARTLAVDLSATSVSGNTSSGLLTAHQNTSIVSFSYATNVIGPADNPSNATRTHAGAYITTVSGVSLSSTVAHNYQLVGDTGGTYTFNWNIARASFSLNWLANTTYTYNGRPQQLAMPRMTGNPRMANEVITFTFENNYSKTNVTNGDINAVDVNGTQWWMERVTAITSTYGGTPLENYDIFLCTNPVHYWRIQPATINDINNDTFLSYPLMPFNQAYKFNGDNPEDAMQQGIDVNYRLAGNIGGINYFYTTDASGTPFEVFYSNVNDLDNPTTDLPSAVGTYRVTVVIPQGNFNANTIYLGMYSITKQLVNLPVATSLTFNRREQTPAAYNKMLYEVTGDEKARDVKVDGDYEAILTLLFPDSFAWADNAANTSATRILTWNIIPYDITSAMVEFDGETATIIELPFIGVQQTPVINVWHALLSGDKELLDLVVQYATAVNAQTEYLILFSDENRSDIGTYVATLTFFNNYRGEIVRTYRIIRNTPSITDLDYNTDLNGDLVNFTFIQGVPQGIGLVGDRTGGFLGTRNVFYDTLLCNNDISCDVNHAGCSFIAGTEPNSAPTNAGFYRVVVVIGQSVGYTGATIALGTYTINKQIVAMPMPNLTFNPIMAGDVYTTGYTGLDITFGLSPATSQFYTVSGDTVGRNAGQYTLTVTHRDTVNRVWTDGTTAPLVFNWEITKVVSVAFATITGNSMAYTTGTLPNLVFDSGSPHPPGTLAWAPHKILPGTHSYTWVFTPNDTVNYTTAQGEIDITGWIPQITSILFVGAPAKQYLAFEEFDTDGLIINLYEDGGVFVGTINFDDPETDFSFSYSSPSWLNNSFRANESALRLRYVTPIFDDGNGGQVGGIALYIEIPVILVRTADPNVVAPTDLTVIFGDDLESAVYSDGQAFNNSVYGSGTKYQGTWTWKENLGVGNVGTKDFIAIFTPADEANLNTIEVFVAVTVVKRGVAVPTVAIGLIYNGGNQNVASWFSGDTLFTASGDVTRRNAGNYTVTVTLRDFNNYYWNDGGANVAVRNIPWAIAQKTISATDITATVAPKTYDGLTSGAVITGGFVAGIIHAGDSVNITLTGAFASPDATSAGGATVNVTSWAIDGADVANYRLDSSVDTIIRTFPATINKATPNATHISFVIPNNHFFSPSEERGIGTVGDNTALKGLGAITVFYEGVDVTYPLSSIAPINAGTYRIIIVVADSGGDGNWNGATITLTQNYTIRQATPTVRPRPSTGGNWSSVSVLFTTGQLPGITLTDGDTSGTIRWVSTTLVAGTNNYQWIFEPTERQNFLTVRGSQTFTVIEPPIREIRAQAGTGLTKVNYTAFDKIDLSGLVVEIIYDDPTSTVKGILDFGATSTYSIVYQNGGDSLRAGDNRITIRYHQAINRDLVITGLTVAKAVPSYTIPIGLTATFGDNLSSVLFPFDPLGQWFWEDFGLVGDAGQRTSLQCLCQTIAITIIPKT